MRRTKGFGWLSAALAQSGAVGAETRGVSAQRYVMGWVALVVATAAVSAGTVVVVRQAIGGGDLVNSLSQSQVRSEYDAAGKPTPSRLATSGATPTTPQPHSTSAMPPPKPHGTTSSHPHASTSSTTPHHHSGGSSSTSPSHPSPSPTSVTRVLASKAGSVVARCSSASSSASVYLVSWSPAQGYSVDDVRRGPAQEAEIDFDGGRDHSVSVTFTCSSSGPVQHVSEDDGGDDSGGSGGGD